VFYDIAILLMHAALGGSFFFAFGYGLSRNVLYLVLQRGGYGRSANKEE
jgi:hypothetical protein